ncbi:tyrosine-protein phosphatase [Leucobacter salsicius]|uniref:tyrosine-protein phosphatase n=1 Tax=Leucobacter salsicius TaxID=664638 RepID=UPI00034A0472|nr:tyrosine-protein phosphatase [Leucobacter salsicius]
MHTIVSVEGSYNARTIGTKHMPWLVRTAALDELTADGERTLRAQGVDLIIDLREPSEQRTRRHGIPVSSVPLYGELPPAHGTIHEIYAGLVRDRGSQIAAAVSAIAAHPGTAAVHCTAGKDRTGIVVALARLVAGDSRTEILADYVLSGNTVRPARAAIVTDQLDSLGLEGAVRAAAEELHLDSPSAALAGALELVNELGGPIAYLLDNGMSVAHLRSLAERA